MNQEKKGATSPSGMSKKPAASVESTDSVVASVHDKDAVPLLVVEKDSAARKTDDETPGALQPLQQMVDANENATGSESLTADSSVVGTPGTGTNPSMGRTPEDGVTPEARGSLSRACITGSDSSEGSSRCKISRRKKSHRSKEGRRQPVVVVSRRNILRDPLHVCLGRPFPSNEDAGSAATAADPKAAPSAGTDNVVAYVTSTNVDGAGLGSASTAATVEEAAEQAELANEKAFLNAILNDLMECIELHSSFKYDVAEDDEQEQRNGLAEPRGERRGSSSKGEGKREPNSAGTCQKESEQRRPDVATGEASLLPLQQPYPTEVKQAVEPHALRSIAGREEAQKSAVNSALDNKEGDYGVDKRPESPDAATKLGVLEDNKQKRSQDVVVHEVPLVYFSMSRTEPTERNEIAPSKGSSGHVTYPGMKEPFVSKQDDGDDDEEEEEEDRGYLDMAFGAGSFTDDLDLGRMGPGNASSPNTASGIQSCWHDFLAPIKMVSKYIQTEWWKEPESESSFSEVVRKRRSGSTKTLHRACSLQITVPERRAAAAGGLGSEESSVEELAKIFAAYSSSPTARVGKDESGRADVKGVVRDRNFGVPSPTTAAGGGGTTTASPTAAAVVVQGCTCDDRASATVVHGSAAE
ncbi:uncharacterized protein [Dermacentor albipictus]|uniref:uncharacterized protein n=1 Tax=Dermacentor albipictus TaxID=60249 RepID=UPI0031FD669C